MLSFTIYFLVKDPQVLARARAEVGAVLGTEMPRMEPLALPTCRRAREELQVSIAYVDQRRDNPTKEHR